MVSIYVSTTYRYVGGNGQDQPALLVYFSASQFVLIQ